MASPPQPSRAPLPTDPASFDADDRISFSRVSNTFLLESEDGEEYEWDAALTRWVAVVDDALLEEQRLAYGGPSPSELAPEPFTQGQKRKAQNSGGRAKKSKAEGGPKERKNTAVYATNLPRDADAEEVEQVFARCGVIAEEIDSGKPRIKMYTDEQGEFKGDALVVYFRAESVALACQLLDDTELRLGKGSGRMRVAEADWTYKKQKEEGPQEQRGDRQRERDKAKVIKRTQKLNSKLADWDDDDPAAAEQTGSRWDKVVILTHMFTMQELDDDPASLLDIKEDIRDECSKLGDVTNVVLYDKEEEGIVSVRFSTPEAAKACIKVMHGRFFGGAQVEAFIATGKEKFKKSSQKIDFEEEDEDGNPGGAGEGPGGGEEIR